MAKKLPLLKYYLLNLEYKSPLKYFVILKI